MTYSIGAFISCIITSLLLLFLLDLMIRKRIYSRKTAGILTVCLFIIAIRMALPFNFPFTITLYSYRILPVLTTPLYTHLFGTSIRTDQVIFAVWIIVTMCLLIRYVVRLIRLKQILNRFRVSADDPQYSPVFNQVRALYDGPFSFSAIPSNISPAVTGLFRMNLIIPVSDDTILEDNVLNHEISHFKLHHIWFNLLFSIASMSQWWNPFMYLLKKDIRCLIEIQADERTVNHQSQEEQLRYAGSIIRYRKNIIEKSGASYCPAPDSDTLYFIAHSPSVLSARINYLIADPVDNAKGSRKKSLAAVLCFCIIALTAASVFLVPESNQFLNELKVQKEEHGDGVIITGDNSYFKKVDGGFALYVDEQYMGTLDEIPNELNTIPVY